MFKMPMPYMGLSYEPRGYDGCPVQKPYKSMKRSIATAKDSIKDEKHDELFYDYLISIAPDEEDMELIRDIRDDEKKHKGMLKEIYGVYTGNEYEMDEDEAEFEKPRDYYDGLKKAFFGEIAAMERYRDMRAGLPDTYYKDMAYEISSDEGEHAVKINYLLNKNKSIVKGESMFVSRNSEEEEVNRKDEVYIHGITPKTAFTLEEAAAVAKQLEIDLAKSRFDLEQLKNGMNVELEHGTRDSKTNVTGDDPVLTGKIALAHLNEFPDYYVRLKKLEDNAKAYWQGKDAMRQKRR